jgi:maleate cis-trans isomerase
VSDERLRLGFLYPGYAAEDDYPYLATLLVPPVLAEVVHTSVGEDAHRVDALLDLGSAERLRAGAEELARRRVASVVWACTSGSFVFGWEGAQRQVAELESRLAVPASSTSLAFVDACAALGVSRVALAATYPEDVTAHLVAFLDAAGVETVAHASRGVVTAAEVGALGDATVRDLVVRHDHPEAQAVLVPDTALHSARLLPGLEQALGKPVLTANQVTVWQAARLAEHPAVGERLGSLFAARARGRA